jgi:WhiB family redox-sensing transcriptional regulator
VSNPHDHPILRPMGDWPDRAACRGYPQHVFFPEKGESTSEAKAVCARCPVLVECAAWARSAPEHYGIWGGLSPKARRGDRIWLCRGCQQEINGVGSAKFCDACRPELRAERQRRYLQRVKNR